ncbi:MATE family efflux transporter [Deferribacter abyssi]|uniref:MATE family efflux transporter n=1 Tax=Deferribacter abyssi TaxID=213806 RepID=UPI003C1D1CC9
MKSLIKKSWSISWPMILIMFFEFLISLTDVYIAGKLGKEYQAAIGFVSQIYFIFIVVVNAITMGTVAVVSRKWGEKNRSELEIIVSSVFILAVFIGIILSSFGVLFAKALILKIPIVVHVRKIAAEFAFFYSFGLVFHYLLILSNGVLRSIKSVKKSLTTMFIVAMSNVALNFLFVFTTPIGYRGVALSTVLSVFFGAVINFFYLRELINKLVLKTDIIKRVLRIGIPSGVLQIGWQLGSTVLFLIINSLKENCVEVMAAFTNGIRIEAAIYLPAFAFNMANAVIIGNLLGENKKNDAFKNGLVTAVMGTIVVLIMTFFVIINARNIAKFLSNDSIVITETINYLYISMISEPFMAWGVILGGAMSGAGDTKTVMKNVLFSLWVIRLPLAFVFVSILGFSASYIWWSMNISILFQCFLMTRQYWKKRWMEYVL